MGYTELLEMLEIEDASEFKYFENFAAILEAEDFIEYDAMHELLLNVDEEALEEFTENYFEEICTSLPDASTEAFIFLKNMQQTLLGKLGNSRTEYIDELFKFRKWYVFDSEVDITSETGKITNESFLNAIFLHREENVKRNSTNAYAFDSALTYEIEDYSFRIGIGGEDDEDELEMDEELREAGMVPGGYIIEDLSDEEFEYKRGLEVEDFEN